MLIFLWGNLGDAYRWTPDNEQRALEAFQQAIRLLRERLNAAPRDLTLRTRLVLYLAKRGDCNEALNETTAIADSVGSDATAWSRLAVAREICGDREAALAALESALQAGYSTAAIQADPELLNLRQDVRYHRLIMRFSSDGGI